MTKDKRYSPGKVDYNGSGRRNCKAVFTWDLKGGRFSMCAEIWNPRETDIYCGGQCVDTVAGFFPANAKVQRMLAIWRDWHLNDMKAGSPAQEAFLKANGHGNTYEANLAKLQDASLSPDERYLHNGKPYVYGSAWLKRELPAEIIAEIESWG